MPERHGAKLLAVRLNSFQVVFLNFGFQRFSTNQLLFCRYMKTIENQNIKVRVFNRFPFQIHFSFA